MRQSIWGKFVLQIIITGCVRRFGLVGGGGTFSRGSWHGAFFLSFQISTGCAQKSLQYLFCFWPFYEVKSRICDRYNFFKLEKSGCQDFLNERRKIWTLWYRVKMWKSQFHKSFFISSSLSVSQSADFFHPPKLKILRTFDMRKERQIWIVRLSSLNPNCVKEPKIDLKCWSIKF